ncbi:hypothetical protein ACFLSV_04690 [Bacteroidota bacterium]
MPKRIAIHYPSKEGTVEPYIKNIYEKLSAGLDLEFGIDISVMNMLQAYTTDIIGAIDKAVKDYNTAQASTKTKNELLAKAKKDILKVLRGIEGHSNFDERHAETLGMRVFKESINYNEVKPKIKRVVTLPSCVEIYWKKARMEGVLVDRSFNGKDFEEIRICNHSPFIDKDKNRSNTPENRFYRLRYMNKDVPVGHYLEVVKILCEIY